MKNKHFKKISLFLSTFILTLFSLSNGVKAEAAPEFTYVSKNIYENSDQLKNELGSFIKFYDGGSTNITCENGAFDENDKCVAGEKQLIGTNTNESFYYRFAVSEKNKGVTVFSLGSPLIRNDFTDVTSKFNKNLIQGQVATTVGTAQFISCLAGIIRQYNSDVQSVQNLYEKSDSNFNQYYYAAQKTIQAFYLDGLNLATQVNKFNTQHYSNNIARTNITYDKIQYNNIDVVRSNTYLSQCVWDAVKADSSNTNRLAGISKDFGSNGTVTVTSTPNDSTKTIEIDIASLYGVTASNTKKNNYLKAQEYNDGSLISVTLKKDGTTISTEKGDNTKKQLSPYVYIETGKWGNTNRFDDKFKINVCYSSDSSSAECKAMRDAYKSYEALKPGEYELEFTLGGVIYDLYETLGYSDYAVTGNNASAFITNNIYKNFSEDKVTFKTTFTVPETSGGEETTNDGAINITYVDEDGNAIKGAIFKISGTSNTCTTKTSGKCSIKGLEVGKSYKVISYSRPSGYDEPTPSSHTVKLTTTSKTKDITFTSSKEEQTTEKGIIKIGYYLDGNTNNGIEGAIFKAVSGSTVKTCTTDADGYCEIKNLDLGKQYNVSAEKVPEGYSNAKNNSDSTTYGITLTAESKTSTLSFKSSKIDTTLGIITVEYLENNNNKILGGKFYLYKVGSSKVIDTCETNSQGTCVFSNLELGEYKVVLNKVPENYEDSKQEKTVTLSKDNLKETIKFRGSLLQTIVKVSVVNYNKVTEYIKGAKLVIKDSSGNVIKEFLSEEKEMVLNDITEPGTYTIEVKEVPEGYEAKDTTYTFEVKESKETNVVIKLIPKTNVPNTLSNASKIFIAAGIIGIITGAYLVYTNIKNKKEEM